MAERVRLLKKMLEIMRDAPESIPLPGQLWNSSCLKPGRKKAAAGIAKRNSCQNKSVKGLKLK